jgi:rubrerythrin
VALLHGTSTEANLRAAFAREAVNHLRLLHFARRADVEGRSEAAAALRDLAEGSTSHALGLLEVLEEVGDPVSGLPLGSTVDHLRSALATEEYEHREMYPGYARVARAEGLHEVAAWFDLLATAEAGHSRALRRFAPPDGVDRG